MIKRFIIIISFFLYLGIVIFTLIKLNSSISPLLPLYYFSDDENPVSKSSKIKLIPPFVSDNETIYCIAELRQAEHQNSVLCKIMPELNMTHILFQFEAKDIIIKGFSREDKTKLFLLKKKNSEFLMLRIIDDSVFHHFPVPLKDNETITALGIGDSNPELITITDSVPQSFKRYWANSRKEFQWEQRQLRPNPFFMRISSPLAAYFKNNWFFLSSSEYYRRDSLYINNPPGTTNVMLFRNNLSYHADDIKVFEKPFTKNHIDITFGGILESYGNCVNHYDYNPNTEEFKKIACPDSNWKNIPVFIMKEFHPERFPLYEQAEDEGSRIMVFNEEQRSVITYSTNHKTKQTLFSFEDQEEAFSKTSAVFQNHFLIPYKTELLFLLDNGYYCKINSQNERIDNVSFKYKIISFAKLFSKKLTDHSSNFSSYSVPVLLAGFPALLVAAMFFFFIVRVFLTPKRPAYSSRKKKKTPLISYLAPVSFLYLAAFFVFVINFVSLLKII